MERHFSTHVPRLLRKQLICNNLQQYLTTAQTESTSYINEFKDIIVKCEPTIERFHGSLLFVDISGFTSLSQRMDVEKLKSFINAYFTKLIDIVYKYDGEIIKFAGDAMFIVWQTRVNALNQPDFIEQARISIANAVACALELIQTCSNYKVDIGHAEKGYYQHILGSLQSATAISRTSRSSVSLPSLQVQTGEFFLNVHCGLSCGLLAGLDVGWEDRWEYLLLGKPLTEVALAEEEAESGELVLSAIAHSLLHGDCTNCSCEQTLTGCFKSSQISTKVKTGARRASESEQEERLKILTEMEVEIMTAHQCMKDKIDSAIAAKMPEQTVDTTVLNNLMKLAQDCLLEDITRHSHEVVRTNYSFANLDRSQLIPMAFMKAREDNEQNHQKDQHATKATRNSRMKQFMNFSFRITPGTKDGPLKDNHQVAELREVIVVFIKLSLHNEEIVETAVAGSEQKLSHIVPEFHFLDRTLAETDLDNQLLVHFQDSFSVIVQEFANSGGQVRQFIVDDKGCVAIGTFGLRGSMSQDNAALAVETARNILFKLKQALDIETSVGITSGKSYCGLVGSSSRHEYAIMGPSVNLAARLMGIAKPATILCDGEIRLRDRLHEYQLQPEVRAKGYSAPVPTFMPLIGIPRFGSTSYDQGDETSISKLSKYSGQSSLRLPPIEKVMDIIGRECNFLQLANIFAKFGTSFRVLQKVLNEDDPPALLQQMELTNQRFFFTKHEAQLAVIQGPSGIGKTWFVQRVVHRLLKMSHLHNEVWNIAVHATPETRWRCTDPFSAWTLCLVSLLSDCYRIDHGKKDFKVLKTHPTALRRRFIEAVKGLHLISNRLPVEKQRLLPLFSQFGKAFAALQENDVTMSLQGIDRQNMLEELIVAVLEAYISKTDKLCVFSLGEVSLMDTASLKLLCTIISKVRGLIVLVEHATGVGQAAAVEIGQTPLKSLEGCLNLSVIVLEELPLTGTCKLLQDILITDDVAYIPTVGDNADLLADKVQAVSSGNPLYVTEIARSLRDYIKTNHILSSNLPHAFEVFMQTCHVYRVEEIVCYRFDQLASECQLILKAIAVCCAFGAPTTFPMLVAVLRAKAFDDNPILPPLLSVSECMKKLHHILGEVLQSKEFLFVEHHSTSYDESPLESSSNRPSNKLRVSAPNIKLSHLAPSAVLDEDEDDITLLSINFVRKLEQQIIYDLMLDEQKAAWHERVAGFLSSEAATRPTSTAQELLELGLHFEGANDHASAMEAFYKSGMILHDLGSLPESRDNLLLAYKMLHKLRALAGIPAGDKLAPVDFQQLFHQLSNNVFADHQSNSIVMSPKGIYRMFRGVEKSLEIALAVLNRLGEVNIMLDSEALITAKFYEEAFEMITMVYKPETFQSGSTSRTTSASNNDLLHPNQRDYEGFRCSNPTVCFAVLKGIISLFRSKKLFDDSSNSRQLFACELFIGIARNSEEKYKIHEAVALGDLRYLYLDNSRYIEAMHICDEMRNIYNPNIHSSELVQVYGSDRLPRVLALNIHMLLLTGRLLKCKDYLLYFNSKLLPIITDSTTLGFVILVLISIYGNILCNFIFCEILWQKYLQIINSQLNKFDFLKEMHLLIENWLLIKLQKYENISLELKQKLKSRHYILINSFPSKKRSYIHEGLDLTSLSIEFLCSEICYEISKYLFLQLTIEFNSKNNTPKHINNKINTTKSFLLLITNENFHNFLECIEFCNLALIYIEFYLNCIENNKYSHFALIQSNELKCYILSLFYKLITIYENNLENELIKNSEFLMNLQLKERSFYLQLFNETLQNFINFNQQNNYYYILYRICSIEERIGLTNITMGMDEEAIAGMKQWHKRDLHAMKTLLEESNASDSSGNNNATSLATVSEKTEEQLSNKSNIPTGNHLTTNPAVTTMMETQDMNQVSLEQPKIEEKTVELEELLLEFSSNYASSALNRPNNYQSNQLTEEYNG